MDTKTLMTLRALKKSAPALLTMLALQRPVGILELVRILEINVRTSESMLQSLVDLGIAERQSYHGGFVLKNVESVMADIFPPNLHILQLPKIEEEESINLNNSESSSTSTLQKTQHRTSERFGVTVSQLLEKSDLLFNSKVIPNGLPVEDLNPDVVLAWMAQVYTGMQRLTSPAAVVYKRLREGVMPSDEYVLDPISRLPHKFLVAIGIDVPDPAPDVIDATWGISPSAEDNGECFDELPAIDAETRQAWEEFKGELAEDSEIPPAWVETWVADTEAIGRDGEALIVKARNLYARNWLEEHMPEYTARFGVVRYMVAR